MIQKYTLPCYVAFRSDIEPFPQKQQTWSLALMCQRLLLSAIGDGCVFPRVTVSAQLWLSDHQLNSITVFIQSAQTKAIPFISEHVHVRKRLRVYNGMSWDPFFGQGFLRRQRKKRKEERVWEKNDGMIDETHHAICSFYFFLTYFPPFVLWSNYPFHCTVGWLPWKRLF